MGTRTPAGADLFALAEWHADIDHSLPTLRATGFLEAAVPVTSGGLGVTDLHDLALASSRLARADRALARMAVRHHRAVLAPPAALELQALFEVHVT